MGNLRHLAAIIVQVARRISARVFNHRDKVVGIVGEVGSVVFGIGHVRFQPPPIKSRRCGAAVAQLLAGDLTERVIRECLKTAVRVINARHTAPAVARVGGRPTEFIGVCQHSAQTIARPTLRRAVRMSRAQDPALRVIGKGRHPAQSIGLLNQETLIVMAVDRLRREAQAVGARGQQRDPVLLKSFHFAIGVRHLGVVETAETLQGCDRGPGFPILFLPEHADL
ncbi:MAG: hypothetical protein PCFJNLEI_02290 [Verrucomicrobiae bacterium]|nr:hypothetical protein [Verrucomicrobiae bacterium]